MFDRFEEIQNTWYEYMKLYLDFKLENIDNRTELWDKGKELLKKIETHLEDALIEYDK